MKLIPKCLNPVTPLQKLEWWNNNSSLSNDGTYYTWGKGIKYPEGGTSARHKYLTDTDEISRAMVTNYNKGTVSMKQNPNNAKTLKIYTLDDDEIRTPKGSKRAIPMVEIRGIFDSNKVDTGGSPSSTFILSDLFKNN